MLNAGNSHVAHRGFAAAIQALVQAKTLNRTGSRQKLLRHHAAKRLSRLPLAAASLVGRSWRTGSRGALVDAHYPRIVRNGGFCRVALVAALKGVIRKKHQKTAPDTPRPVVRRCTYTGGVTGPTRGYESGNRVRPRTREAHLYQRNGAAGI